MTKPLPKHYIEKLKMAVVFGECVRECLSGPGNTEYLPAVGSRQDYLPYRQYTLYSWRESSRLIRQNGGVVSECCWELRCCPRQPPPVTEPWLHTDCWRGFKPLVPSDKRFNHSKVWCTFISSSTSTVYAVQVQVLYSTLLQSCIYCIYCIYRYLPIDAIDAIR